ncbi:alcohol dehydrogenase [Leifsonia sp. ku-ls]|nr:alcohol dehydrogenase [Leifsonia sp. ku-ls]
MSRVVVFDRFGGPEVLHLLDERPADPSPGEVRVRMQAAAVNPIDAMARSGASPAPVPLPHARLGVEGTGVVDVVGDGVTDTHGGDPVIVTAIPDAVAGGSYADHVVVPAADLIPRPPQLSVPEAAATWVGFSTAYGALVEVGGMRPGDHVLVTGATGGVGRAAIDVANRLGAVPIALTRRAARAAELTAAGAAAVVAADRDDVVEEVRRLTEGRGADLVLDLVRGPGQADLVRATRTGGTVVAAGFLDPRPTPEPSRSDVTVVGYRGFDHLADPAVVGRMAAFFADGVRLGTLRPALDRTFPLEDVVEAHRRFDSGANAGRKIVLTM